MSYLLEVMLRKSLEIYMQNSFEELTSSRRAPAALKKIMVPSSSLTFKPVLYLKKSVTLFFLL